MNPKFEVTLSIIVYSITSGTMLLLNKLAVHHLPYPSLVSSMQIASTLLIVYGGNLLGLLEVDKIVWKNVVPYCAFVTTFCLGILCNMHSLETSNVETVIVFRGLTPVGVAILDSFFLGRELPSLRSWIALSLIVFGTYTYASFDEKFQTQGYSAYAWPFMYFCVMCIEMCVAKKVISDVKMNTLSGPVAYTNLLGLGPMLTFAWLGNEFSRFSEDRAAGVPISNAAFFFLALSALAGTAIGYAGWWCRNLISATSFTLVGVINKCLTIMLNLVVWDQHANTQGVMALLVCLAGGTMYQQAPMRQNKVKVTVDDDEGAEGASNDGYGSDLESETESLVGSSTNQPKPTKQVDTQ